jgi:hypothetical protein
MTEPTSPFHPFIWNGSNPNGQISSYLLKILRILYFNAYAPFKEQKMLVIDGMPYYARLY